MTVIIGVAVKPKQLGKPYFIMGADSKKVDGYEVEPGKFIYDVDENSNKIIEFGDKLCGVAGRVPPILFEELPTFLKENDRDLEGLCKLVIVYLETLFKKKDKLLTEKHNYYRANAIIGSCEKGIPRIAKIEVDTRNADWISYSVQEQTEIGFTTEFVGATQRVRDLQAKFINDVSTNNSNFNRLIMGNIATEYLKEAAKRYPESCNQNVKLKIID